MLRHKGGFAGRQHEEQVCAVGFQAVVDGFSIATFSAMLFFALVIHAQVGADVGFFI